MSGDSIRAMPVAVPAPSDWKSEWDGSALDLPAGGTLVLQSDKQRNGEIHVALQVRYRQGGEHLKPAGKPHTRELRLLLQEAGMPPWLRAQVPLIYAQDELIAAGDVFLSDAACELCARLEARIVWKRGLRAEG